MGVYLIHDASATRRDPLRAQQLTVQALLPLKDELVRAPRPVRRGYSARLRRARMNLAYVLLRTGRGAEALQAVAPSMLDSPGVRSLRDVAAVAWNAVRQGMVKG
jgi:hypothetical protein